MQDAVKQRSVRTARLGTCGLLGGILAAFLFLRTPAAYQRPGGVDEDWFSVPGWTVAHEGIPRIPYAPSRNKQSILYRADDSLFFLPPGYFYWQAPLYWFFPAGYGTARLASILAGLFTLGVVSRLTNLVSKDALAGLIAVGLLSISRVFFFPAVTVRPDMLCCLLGLAAMLGLFCWHQTERKKFLMLSGACLGLGLLTHPMAMVFCLQGAGWTFLKPGRSLSARAGSTLILSAWAFLFVTPWLVFISQDPELFWIQFSNNVLNRSGPGLASRLIWPWPAATAQIELLMTRTGRFQFSVLAAGLLLTTFLAIRRDPPRGARALALLGWSALYLLIACVGDHPTVAYWCYPSAFCIMGLALSLTQVNRFVSLSHARSQGIAAMSAVVLGIAHVPGSGLGECWQHIQHWNDPRYDARALTDQILQDIPAQAVCLADRSFVFPVYLSGRTTYLGENSERFFVVRGIEYDYLILNPRESRPELPEQLGAELWKTYGDRDDLYQSVAYVYRSPRILLHAVASPSDSIHNRHDGSVRCAECGPCRDESPIGRNIHSLFPEKIPGNGRDS